MAFKPLNHLVACLVPLTFMAIGCSACAGWRPYSGESELLEKEQQKQSVRDLLARVLENPGTEVRDVQGKCLGWLDSNRCQATFSLTAPLRLRDRSARRVPCNQEDVAAVLAELGWTKTAGDAPVQGECFLVGDQTAGESVLAACVAARRNCVVREVSMAR